uniref:Stard13_1 protein n=1 Tax=Fopius arisanus TaxID=64838 RepID=A0A0C9R3I9_9HYME
MDGSECTIRGPGPDKSMGTVDCQLNLNSSTGYNSLVIGESDNHHQPCKSNHSTSLRTLKKPDPYRELEIYLARVIEEIDDIIITTPPLPSPSPQKVSKPVHHPDTSTSSTIKIPQDPPNSTIKVTNDLNSSCLTALPPLKITGLLPPPKPSPASDPPVIRYQDLLQEFGISDERITDNSTPKCGQSPKIESPINSSGTSTRTTEDSSENLLNSDYAEPRDSIPVVGGSRRRSGSLPVSLNDTTNKDYDGTSSDYDEPLYNDSQNDLKILENRNSSSLPIDLECSSQRQSNFNDYTVITNEREPKKLVDLSLRFNSDEMSQSNARLPPRQSSDNRERRKNISVSPMSFRKRSGKHQGITELTSGALSSINNENDLMFINNSTRSAPVTPTDEKRLFSRFLPKHHSPLYDDDQQKVELIRVSSLPEQTFDTPREQLTSLRKNSVPIVALGRKRSVSPVTLRSDLIAKRLSESDKDAGMMCWNKERISSGTGLHGGITGECWNGQIGADKSIEDKDGKVADDERSPSIAMSLTGLLLRLRTGTGSCCPASPPTESFTCSDMATQTSPAISRSSSFTWVSDGESPRESRLDIQSLQDESVLDPSAQDTVDDDNRSSSSSQDLLQSMDEISSGSISPDTTDGTSPLESGIGTASPPRSTDRRIINPSTAKCQRKETWEKIRRRPSKLSSRYNKSRSADVWVKRESVHTQTNENIDQAFQENDSSSQEDTLPRTKPSRSSDLPLGLTMTTSSSLSSGEMLESLPRVVSSSSAGCLQLKHEPLTVELSGKSNSAPLLENNDKAEKTQPKQRIQYVRSQSECYLSEIEAQEACKWLRAAGFPQYAQMYEDCQFPIEVSGVAKDHPFLEADSLQSLYRRLHALNRCANMKLDTHHTHHHHNTSHSKSSNRGGEDSDEDTQCALSENWTFEKKTRRWSRVCDVTQANLERLQAIAGQIPTEEESLEDRLEAEEASDTMMDNRFATSPNPLPDDMSPKFRRTGSERLRDGAKAFLRRVESLKSRRRKRQNREGVVISGPQVLDVMSMQQKMKDLNCVDVSPTGISPMTFDLLPPSPLNRPISPLTLPPSPYHLPVQTNLPLTSPFGDDSSSYCSDGSQGGGPTPTLPRNKMNKARKFLYRNREDQGALSDSECQPSSWRHRYLKDANSNHTKIFEYVNVQPQTKNQHQNQSLSPKPEKKSKEINTRGGSLNLGKDSQRYRDKLSKDDKSSKREEKLHKSFRHVRDDSYKECKQLAKEVTVTVYREKSRSRSSELASQESSSTMASRDSDQEEESPRLKSSVVRWHSFQRGSLYPEPLDPLCQRAMASMSCGQLLVLRKLALLKLTACMERYCPTHRTGWNWELPKFIRKIKSPDYKDKTVFGVPLLLSLQRTGQALPKCMQIALRWLRANALDQIGIFRKSGVRSRIQKLKAMTEIQGDNINFDGQQAFDVADLVKQYFRELPEALLTNKLSETFIAIFQHVPVELRPDAVQCVLLLLPDEHREALETLLDFLNHVASNSPYNQMTASNLAVCLAPSLFHFNHTNSNVANRSSSVSPRRRKTVGIPDQRELSENKAAHDCLLYLIKLHRELFMVSSDMLTQCHFNYMEESVPVALEELGSEMKQNWRGYMYACTTALLKEAREKSRGWVTVSNPPDPSIEMAYKKVGDGHPLRLWRVSTEVEAPPNELLHRVLRERHIWDSQLLKYRLVKKTRLRR